MTVVSVCQPGELLAPSALISAENFKGYFSYYPHLYQSTGAFRCSMNTHFILRKLNLKQLKQKSITDESQYFNIFGDVLHLNKCLMLIFCFCPKRYVKRRCF